MTEEVSSRILHIYSTYIIRVMIQIIMAPLLVSLILSIFFSLSFVFAEGNKTFIINFESIKVNNPHTKGINNNLWDLDLIVSRRKCQSHQTDPSQYGQ
jgi:hypothetical protein